MSQTMFRKRGCAERALLLVVWSLQVSCCYFSKQVAVASLWRGRGVIPHGKISLFVQLGACRFPSSFRRIYSSNTCPSADACVSHVPCWSAELSIPVEPDIDIDRIVAYLRLVWLFA